MDLVAVGRAAVAKNWSGLFSALVGAGEDTPPIISNWSDLKPELEALLANPEADADLVAYAASLFSTESASAQEIIKASVDLLLTIASKTATLVKAIENKSPGV